MPPARGRGRGQGAGRKRRKHNSDNSESSDSGLSQPRVRKTSAPTRKRQQHKSELSLVLPEDDLDKSKAISWNNMTAGPSDFPCRKFCSVCGYFASSRCAACSSMRPHHVLRYLCTSLECSMVHKDTNCGKPQTRLQ
eukprot:Lankesteria_metandrocarpae@DN1768_c0_g1_i2.p1